jgi:hypothetical protein
MVKRLLSVIVFLVYFPVVFLVPLEVMVYGIRWIITGKEFPHYLFIRLLLWLD